MQKMCLLKIQATDKNSKEISRVGCFQVFFLFRQAEWEIPTGINPGKIQRGVAE